MEYNDTICLMLRAHLHGLSSGTDVLGLTVFIPIFYGANQPETKPASHLMRKAMTRIFCTIQIILQNSWDTLRYASWNTYGH